MRTTIAVIRDGMLRENIDRATSSPPRVIALGNHTLSPEALPLFDG